MGRYLSINVFEQPWLLAAIGLWLEMGLLLAGRYWPLRVRPRHLLIGPGLVVLAFALDWAVVTDREKIEAVIGVVVKAAEQEQAELIIECLGPGYKGTIGQSREEFADFCRWIFRAPVIEENWVLSRELELARPRATVRLTVFSQLDRSGPWAQYLPSAKTIWQIQLTKQTNKSWRITWIELVRLNNERIDWDSTQMQRMIGY